MSEQDRNVQRILWRKERTDQSFSLTTVTYDTVCAPFLALRCPKQLTINYVKNYPLATQDIQ